MNYRHSSLIVSMLLLSSLSAQAADVTKLKDVVIYRDDTFYSAFPSIVRRPDGELLVAFRRAPEPRNFGNGPQTHTDPCSQLVIVRSTDGGETWTKEPQLLFAHPRGGLQDPCLLQLDDGSLLCSSYAWALIPPGGPREKLKKPSAYNNFVFMGGTMYRSEDAGAHWRETLLPPTRGEPNLDPFNKPLPAYNRGAMCQLKDGRVCWATAMEATSAKRSTGVHLMISEDRGRTWNYSCAVAVDEKVQFNETSLYETPRGDLVAFMRTHEFDDHTTIARSRDGGKSFQKWQDAGFRGHPHHAIRLPDNRVLLVYGYRHAPFGIRARVLDAECTDFATAPEIVLRDDGGHEDLGYPWATVVGDDRALVVYYFNQSDGTRHIAGTMVKIKP
jgi:sialidase-1